MTTVTQTQQLLDLGARKSKNKQTFKGERNFFISGADSWTLQSIEISAQIRIWW